jgi:hypothetical protein
LWAAIAHIDARVIALPHEHVMEHTGWTSRLSQSWRCKRGPQHWRKPRHCTEVTF